ncbi:MAG: transcriptional regulator [Pseudomonadales bacterium]|jgi:transcriptional regulator
MYIPKYFEITDKNEQYAFIAANGFGQLISSSAGRPYSTHLPFLLSDDKTKLLAHLAIQNPQVDNIADQQVLVTLQGTHDYISPSWYQSPGVPTWNYQAVHIYGTCETFTDIDRLEDIVNKLTAKYESCLPSPWAPDYNPKMLNAIIGIEISISEIQCNYKLSQNRPQQDQQQVIDQLNTNGSTDLAAAMQ